MMELAKQYQAQAKREQEARTILSPTEPLEQCHVPDVRGQR